MLYLTECGLAGSLLCAVKVKGSSEGTALCCHIHSPVRMCQKISPSLMGPVETRKNRAKRRAVRSFITSFFMAIILSEGQQPRQCANKPRGHPGGAFSLQGTLSEGKKKGVENPPPSIKQSKKDYLLWHCKHIAEPALDTARNGDVAPVPGV